MTALSSETIQEGAWKVARVLGALGSFQGREYLAPHFNLEGADHG